VRCDGCTKCLLWHDDGSQRLAAAERLRRQVAAMRELAACGFGNLLSLVSTLLPAVGTLPDTGVHCGCGVGTRTCEKARSE
jgi:MFS superfamily sulfate permease-like transporter